MGTSDKLEGDSGQSSQLWQSMLSPPHAVSSSSPRSDSSTKSDEISNIRVKLMCSYGGKILPRPNDSQLRYMGGETRIVVVDRAITLPELLQKLRKLAGKSMLLKYQLPGEDLDALVSVRSDEDLDNMMEEYDRLIQRDVAARLRVFLFPDKQQQDVFVSATRASDQQFIDALNGIGTGVPALPAMRAAAGENLAAGSGMEIATAFHGLEVTGDVSNKLPESLDVDDEGAILFGNNEFHFTPVGRSMSPQRLPPACLPLCSTPQAPATSPVFRSPPEGSAIYTARQQQRHLSEQQPRSGSKSPTRNSSVLLDDSPRSARAAMSPSRFRDSPLSHARQVIGTPATAAAAAAGLNPGIAPGMGFAPAAHQHHLNPAVPSLLRPDDYSSRVNPFADASVSSSAPPPVLVEVEEKKGGNS